MKIIKTASNYNLKLSHKEWLEIGKKAGWKVANLRDQTTHELFSTVEVYFKKAQNAYNLQSNGKPSDENLREARKALEMVADAAQFLSQRIASNIPESRARSQMPISPEPKNPVQQVSGPSDPRGLDGAADYGYGPGVD